MSDGGFSNHAELKQVLLQKNVPVETAEHLAALGKTAILLEAAPDAKVFSKFGGAPDLPAGTDWPERVPQPSPQKAGLLTRLFGGAKTENVASPERYPLNFIAQISFGELAQTGGLDPDFPTTGALFIFYDDLDQPWGLGPDDMGGTKVIFSASVVDLDMRLRPEAPPNMPTYPDTPVVPHLRFESPSPEGPHVDELPISKDELSRCYAALWELSGNEDEPVDPVNKVGGWAEFLQGAMEYECAMLHEGIDLTQTGAYGSPDAQRARKTSSEWTLLMQINSQAAPGMMWGDAGVLYIWIRKEDLKARNFENCCLKLQCF